MQRGCDHVKLRCCQSRLKATHTVWRGLKPCSVFASMNAPLPRLHGFHHMLRMRLTTSGVMRGSIALRGTKLKLWKGTSRRHCHTQGKQVLLLYLLNPT